MRSNITNTHFIASIKELLQSARNSIYQTINTTMTQTYWEIGRRIVEEEQGGETRAEYGKGLIKQLSIELTAEFSEGFSVDNLKNMRRFYLAYPKSETASHRFKLSYSHYIFLTPQPKAMGGPEGNKTKIVPQTDDNVKINRKGLGYDV